MEISGYPEVGTVTICAWTSSTRPSASSNGKYTLGFNTTLNIFEIIDPNGNPINILDSIISAREIALLVYPVGSYYETSDSSFDPNVTWGGVWELVNDGRFLLATSSSYAINSTGGEETHTLTKNEMPKHDHVHNHQHSHTLGNIDVQGTFPLPSEARYDANNHFSGAFTKGETTTGSWSSDADKMGSLLVNFNFANGLSGETSIDDTQNSAANVGGGQAHNNMPPYRVVNRWHRTA